MVYCHAVKTLRAGQSNAPARPFELYAIMTVWNESDIIESTVRNLFAEGCNRVFILDNDSDDDTVHKAVGAGAECLGSFATEIFSDNIRTDKLNEAVQDIMAGVPKQSVWWLFLDADEFPTAPGAKTIREFLTCQDDAVRCVGSTWVNHFPGPRPYWVEGFHPAEIQRLSGVIQPATGFNLWGSYCAQGHVKHQLVRMDPSRPRVEMGLGFHTFECDEHLYEPQGRIWVHHFQFRDRDSTLNKLNRLTKRDDNGNSRHATKAQWNQFAEGAENMSTRVQYNRRQNLAPLMYDTEHQPRILGYVPENWIDLLGGLERGPEPPGISRWYEDKELFTAVSGMLPQNEYAIWLAHYYFDNKQFRRLIRHIPGLRARNADEQALQLFMEFSGHMGLGSVREAMRPCQALAKHHPDNALTRQAVAKLTQAHQERSHA